MRQRTGIRSAAAAHPWVWLAMVLVIALAGCAQEGAADDASEAASAAAPADSSADAPDAAGDAPDVLALCEQFFDDIAPLAESGDVDAMVEAVRSWADAAQGSEIENEVTTLSDTLTQLSSGDLDAMGEDFTTASTEFATQCAANGWTPSQ